jgi:hypothetical protein
MSQNLQFTQFIVFVMGDRWVLLNQTVTVTANGPVFGNEYLKFQRGLLIPIPGLGQIIRDNLMPVSQTGMNRTPPCARVCKKPVTSQCVQEIGI